MLSSTGKKIRVVIVDDSAFIRQMFSKFLLSDPEIDVVGTAADPLIAREKIKSTNPDVITLDVEMPNMDGLTFLEKIMRLRPTPVVMVSSLTQKGAEITLQALELGAVDCIAKPGGGDASLEDIRSELLDKVKSAAAARVTGRKPKSARPPAGLEFRGNPRSKLIAIGASTGGVEAIRDILLEMPATTPPIVITQHMPEMFTKSFADRLDKICNIRVVEAQDRQVLEPSTAYIAPGGMHLRIRKTSGGLMTQLDDGPAVSSHKPSVDVLFESVAEQAAKQTVAAILTGMGRDGAQGILKLRKAGAKTIGQSEPSCVVYGMPKAAMQLGGVEKEYALSEIARELLQRCM